MCLLDIGPQPHNLQPMVSSQPPLMDRDELRRRLGDAATRRLAESTAMGLVGEDYEMAVVNGQGTSLTTSRLSQRVEGELCALTGGGRWQHASLTWSVTCVFVVAL